VDIYDNDTLTIVASYVRVSLPKIEHNEVGFSALAHLLDETTDCFLDDIEIDMSNASWFDADMR
jgi:hypothetical protein